ncbi:sugar porter family MFS transporter [Aeromonas hydrophila]|nr:sugar porter family MFS transporter [Aeromonas hydrophila]
MDWQTALKIGGPSAVISWVFYELFSTYLFSSNIFKDNVLLNIIFIVTTFTFCLAMGIYLIKRSTNKHNQAEDVETNLPNEMNEVPAKEIDNLNIYNNEVDGNLMIGHGQSVTNSTVNDNKVKKDLIIGGNK